MVATVTALGAAQSTVHYFERDGYYARNDPEHRRASFWHGRGAAALRLRGHVRPRRFEEVLAGYVPHTDIRLGRKRDGAHQHRPGLDLTLSAPKSVSLEALVFGERRVVRAHDEAVRETLDWVESELLQTRGYDPATGRRPRVRGEAMVAAGFRHLTSRDQDPQLHTHCVIANMTRNAQGEWRSLEPTRVHRNEKLIGAYYRNALALRLQALGYAIAPTLIGRVPGFEIAGYARALLDAFSGRRRALLAWLAARGLPYTPALAQSAALATRRRKVNIGLGLLIPRWRERARALGLGRSALEARPPRPLDVETGRRAARARVPQPRLPANVVRNRRRAPALPALSPEADLERPDAARASPTAPPLLLRTPETGVLEVVARAARALAERRAVFPEAELRALALGASPGRYTLAEVDAAVARLVDDGALVEALRPGAERAFVTAEAVRAERRLLATMRSARGRGGALTQTPVPEALPGGAALTRGQGEAVEAIARAPDWLIGVQGHAGSGKTAMLRAAAALPGMPRLHGLAPSVAAVRALSRGAGIEARTLQSFLSRFEALATPEPLARARETYAGTVLVLDEASMVGTAQVAALLHTAKRLGVARVVLVGDTRQLRAVDAGQPFRVLQRARMATAVMDEVLRQRDPALGAAVAAVRDGPPGAALRTLGERVHETERERLGEAAGAVWLALPDAARAGTLVLAPTHALRRAIHATIREGLAREGVLHGPTLHLERLVDRRLTRAETADLRSYAVGDPVAFHRDAYGARAGDHCEVAAVSENQVTLAHPDGTPRRFRPSGNVTRYLRVFDTAPIELRAGDQVRWTRNRPTGRAKRPALVNGDTARVLAIDARRVRFVTEYGTRFSLARGDPQLRHLDHAYSATVHAAQGRTARAVIAVLDSAGLSDRTLLYVQMSRAAEDFVLLTDDREALADTLARREGAGDGALEGIGEALTRPPAVAPELFERLRADWTALRDRAWANDDLPCFTPGYAALVARAGALAAVEDLPPDMRRFTDTLLEDHAQHRARRETVERLVTRLQAHWRRWPELDWAQAHHPRDAEAAAHAEPAVRTAWRAEARALLDAARALRERKAPGALHLDADLDVQAGLDSALGALERVCAREDFRRFAREWARLRGPASPAPLHAPGYAALAALGERLRRDATLGPSERPTLDAWHAAHEAETARVARIERYPAEAGVLAETWRRYAATEADPDEPRLRRWRREAEALLAEGRAMLGPKSAHAAALSARPEAGAALREAVSALARAHTDQACRAFEWLSREVERTAQGAGTLACYAPRYDELAEWAHALHALDAVPEPTRARLAAWREAHEAWLRGRAALETYAERVEALRVPPHPDRPEWRRAALALADTGRAVLVLFPSLSG